MKKIAIVTLSISLLLNFSALAQENPKNRENSENKENFTKHKSEILTSLNKEKSVIESSIACINSASTKEDVRACHDKTKSARDALRDEREAGREKRVSERRDRLEDGIKKIDERQKERSSKANSSDSSSRN